MACIMSSVLHMPSYEPELIDGNNNKACPGDTEVKERRKRKAKERKQNKRTLSRREVLG
jgi:hypothetical protein